MPRALSDGRTKVAILFTKPANPAAPTIDELAAGVDAGGGILSSDFTFSATDSDKVAEKPLSQVSNANALGPSNFQAGMTVFRYFDSITGNAHSTEDNVYQAIKGKGTEAWIYARKNGKLATDAWATGDEIYLGMHVISDEPAEPSSQGGYIKRRIPLEPQNGWPNIAAAAGSGTAVPIISAATPSGALATKIVTITGARFTGVTAVTFGGTNATAFTVIADNLLAATMPTGSAGSAAIVVTNAAGASASFAYTRGA